MRFAYLLLSCSVLSTPSWAQHFIPAAKPAAIPYAVGHTPLTPTAASTLTAPQPSGTQAPHVITIPATPERKQTHKLFELQANQKRSGQALPILGATADRSWQRYLDSFSHPMPEQFEKHIELGSD